VSGSGKAAAFIGTLPEMFYTHLLPPCRSAPSPFFFPIGNSTAATAPPIFHRGYFPPFRNSPKNPSNDANLFHCFSALPFATFYHTLWREEIYGGDKELF
jgi:hypothetical protein